jgi:hypothetical protein
MKIIKVDCDWETQEAKIKIQRINPKTGAFETNRYKRGRFASSSNRLVKILDKSESRYPEYYYRGE